MENLMFLPWEAWVVSQARAKRRASAPCFWMTSRGSMVFPFTFDIFSPFSSVTMVCRYTVRKGTLFMKCSPAIIMRATQKNRMS
jgi:hypothetical protein